VKDYTLQAKTAVVDDIKDKFSRAESAVLVDYRGLTVEQDTELRCKMREAGVEYKVLKNTMIKRALHALEIDAIDGLLEGPTAVAFGYDDAVAPAKVLSEFCKKNNVMEIKGGLLGDKAMDLNQIKYLAELPSKEVLIAKLLGSMNAPISNFVGVLSGVPRAFVCALNEIKNKKEA